MFGFGRNKQEQPQTHPEVELRKQIEASKDTITENRNTLLELRRTEPENSEILKNAMDSFVYNLDEYARLTSLLQAELEKTPGQKLTDTWARTQQELAAMCRRVNELNEELGPDSTETIALEEEIIRKFDELVALDELEAKMNNRPIDDAA